MCDLEKYVADQDVILVGGGNTKSMLACGGEWCLSSSRTTRGHSVGHDQTYASEPSLVGSRLSPYDLRRTWT